MSSSKKIYIVNVSTTLVVAAKDEREARKVGQRSVSVADFGADLEVVVGPQVEALADLPRGWGGGTLPFGTDSETIAQILGVAE